ncbi:MAG TPA: hypothetical protein VM866_06630 [Pyrinomonadaceae bacterium]|jgi:hypothetical protein|nr:hypothetical protein [Pyrinomonadaceae bacterium]
MMQHDPKQAHYDGTAAMHQRRITLDDGRYLIFYTFDESQTPPPSDAKISSQQPDAIPVAEEERSV